MSIATYEIIWLIGASIAVMLLFSILTLWVADIAVDLLESL